MSSIEIDVRSVLRAIQEPEIFGGAPPRWDEAMAAMPENLPAFLDVAALSERRAAAGLPAARDPLLREVVAEVAADPALLRFAWYVHWQMFGAPKRDVPWGLPTLTARLGRRAGMFYELLALEFPVRLAVWHRSLGYPPDVTTQTVRQISAFEGNHMRGRGFPGLYETQFPWLATYLSNNYVRLGRFEYLLANHYGVNVWKRARDGRVLALADDGARVDENGLRLPGNAPANAGWTARQEASADAVTGYPIDPAGRVVRKQVRLARSDWAPCLKKGMPVLDLHIPAGGGMNWEAVIDSFAQALEFFSRHHPDRLFTALVCQTWFLDPQLENILPSSSNILRLQRAVYLVPTPPNPGGLWFVFLNDGAIKDPAALPRDSALRRALADFLKAGGTWNGGGMFLLPEDMAHPREGLYRDSFGILFPELSE